MSKLTKSLSELDAMADELLNKSEPTPTMEENTDLEKSAKSEDDAEELKPDEVSENVPDEEVKNTEESKEKADENAEEDKTDEKEEQEEVVEKSIDSDKVTEEDGEEDEDKKKEELEKSLHSNFEENDEIKKSIDASAFLSAVTEVISKSLADVVYNLQGSSQQNIDSNEVLAKSLQASLSLNKSMGEELSAVKAQNEELKKSIQEGFDELKDYVAGQIEELSHQPITMRKSVSNMSVHDRNFQKSLGGNQLSASLSKGEVLAKLNACMYSGNPLVTPNDIISYESGAPLRPEVAQMIYGNM